MSHPDTVGRCGQAVWVGCTQRFPSVRGGTTQSVGAGGVDRMHAALSPLSPPLPRAAADGEDDDDGGIIKQ